MKNSTKIVLAAATLFAMTGTEKINAQTFMLWKGDFRMGLSAGVSHNFKAFDLTVPTGYTLDGDATTAVVTPSIGLYSGMEKKLNRNLSFGFDATAVYSRPTTYATLKNTSGNTYDYTFSVNNIMVNEQVYFAFALDRKTQAQFNIGAGFFERIMIGGTATSESGASAPACAFGDGSSFGFNFGADVSTGITYYLSDVFFVKGSVYALIPIISSSKLLDDWNDGWGGSSSNTLTASANSGFELGLSACIGFKW